MSRYLAALEKWLGKKLILPGDVIDPDDARVSVGLTDEGRDFFGIAETTVRDLQGFRSEAVRRDEIMDGMGALIKRMQLDREINLQVAELVRDNVDTFHKLHDALCDKVAISDLQVIYESMRSFFAEYEEHRSKELRLKRRQKSTLATSAL